MEKVSYPTQAPRAAPNATPNATPQFSQTADINVDVQAPPSYEQATGATPAPYFNNPVPPSQQPQPTYTTTTQMGWNVNSYNLPPVGGIQQTTYAYTTQGQPPVIQAPPVVIIQQPTHVTLGPNPCYIICPFCHVQKMTRVEYEPNARTHLMALFLCLFGFWCCMCLPYCVGSCMSSNHYCGNCNKFIGTYGAGDL